MADKIANSVIVRAFGDEPVRLRAVGVREHGRVVDVAGEDAARSIGFPRDRVYKDDRTAFGRLREAYDKGRTDDLNRLWGRMARFDASKG